MYAGCLHSHTHSAQLIYSVQYTSAELGWGGGGGGAGGRARTLYISGVWSRKVGHENVLCACRRTFAFYLMLIGPHVLQAADTTEVDSVVPLLHDSPRPLSFHTNRMGAGWGFGGKSRWSQVAAPQSHCWPLCRQSPDT